MTIIKKLVIVQCAFIVVLYLFFFSSRRRHTRCALVTGVQTCALPICSAMQEARTLAVPTDFCVCPIAQMRVAGRSLASISATRLRCSQIGRASCRERVCQYV